MFHNMFGDTPRLSRVGAGLITGLSLLIAPVAQADEPEGYVTDSPGEVVRSGFGDCVHTSSWSQDMAIMECEPRLAEANRPEPDMAAMEPEPEPEPQPVLRRINLSSDTYFEFDRAVLTQEGQQKLDEIARALKQARDPSIHIVGHADRIGSEDYNLKLSRDRAHAVEQYLRQRGVPAQALQVSAMGESSPVKECGGMRGQALIDCLGPNRRTEIEFSAFEVVEPER
ncbi:MAG TPA: OmpA family protein [Thiohalobacter sp.]|nr:OmpA family protein [Thiohalobacter sp.]